MTTWIESRRAAPSEQCPNCGGWYVMGDCRFSSVGRGTLYGVCSECARRHGEFSANITGAVGECAPVKEE